MPSQTPRTFHYTICGNSEHMIYCRCKNGLKHEVINVKTIFFSAGFSVIDTSIIRLQQHFNASLNSQFTLAPGQSARIASESMNIKFIGVTQDSRCPTGVECIRAGRVSCDVEITKDGTENSVTLTDTPDQVFRGYTFQNYKIVFSVSPYPEAGKTIAKSDYRLSMTVSKLAN